MNITICGTVTHGLVTDPTITGGRISRADLAAFALDHLADDTYLRSAVSIT